MSYETILTTLRTMFDEGADLVEVRALKVPHNRRKVTCSGYFKDFSKAAEAAVELDEKEASGVYVNLNQLHSGCYARSPDQLTYSPEFAASDRDIIARKWILFDFDPIRPAGVSSTDSELQYAYMQALEFVEDYVRPQQREFILACSGNGYHVLMRAEPDWGTDDCRRLLHDLSIRFSDDRIELDTSVYNPARITKLYGTTARKGHATNDRPHRRSRIEPVPSDAACLTPASFLN